MAEGTPESTANATHVDEDAKLRTENVDDSGYKDEDLPVALKKLLQRLEGTPELGLDAATYVPILSQAKYGDFFTNVASSSSKMQIRKQVRLRVLKAIGSCNTLQVLRVPDGCTYSELEAVLLPLQSNSELTKIVIRRLESSNDADVESCWLLLGQLLQTSHTLDRLIIEDCRLTPTGMSHLASGLRGNSQSAVQLLNLDLGHDASLTLHMAEIVSVAPKLRHLTLRGLEVPDESILGILSQAFRQNTRLETLFLYVGGCRGENRMKEILLNIFTGEDSNQSISNLTLAGKATCTFDCFAEIASLNRSLKIIYLHVDYVASTNQGGRIGQSLCSNSTLDALYIFGAWYEWRENIQARVLELITAADVKRPIIHLHIGSSKEGEDDSIKGDDLEWRFLVQALRNNFPSLASILLDYADLNAQASLRQPGGQGFLDALGNNSTLQSLGIRFGTRDFFQGGWKQLFKSLRVNTSLTRLGL
ncbi:hypothetical protein Mapa_011857 [Marchantia paleacea]|nr:hypothetical protein Mapa_011857 [Marchantia paleacea]